MRIALVHTFSWPTVRRGAERYLHDLGAWLVGRGHDVDVVTSLSDPPPLAATGVRVRTVPLWLPTHLARRGLTTVDTFGASAIRALAGSRYDVVHAFVPSAALAGAATLHPCVYTALGHPSPANPPSHWWSRLLLRQAVTTARVPTALSASAADGVEALVGRRPAVIPPGVFTQRFTPELSARGGSPRILFNAFAGDQRKRLTTLMSAMPAVLDAHPDARLWLGGGGDPSAAFAALPRSLQARVEAAIDDLGTGSVDDVPERYRQSTVTVLPSVDEAFGLVLAESLACGTPVVCVSSGGAPEIVSPDVGRVAAPEDPASLAAAILDAVTLAADPAAPRQCVERAQRWDWDVVGPAHELAYAKARG